MSTEKISEWKLSLAVNENGDPFENTIDFLPLDGVNFPNNEIRAGRCALDLVFQNVSRCVSANYNTTLRAIASSVPVCTAIDYLEFGWDIPLTNVPSDVPSDVPSEVPSDEPSGVPSNVPSDKPGDKLIGEPNEVPIQEKYRSN